MTIRSFDTLGTVSHAGFRTAVLIWMLNEPDKAVSLGTRGKRLWTRIRMICM